DGIRDGHVTGVQTCALPISRPKVASVPLRSGTAAITGIAKGSGMIHPQLATMLVYILTDVIATPAELGAGLRAACDESFNVISRSEERRVGKECRCRWS